MINFDLFKDMNRQNSDLETLLVKYGEPFTIEVATLFIKRLIKMHDQQQLKIDAMEECLNKPYSNQALSKRISALESVWVNVASDIYNIQESLNTIDAQIDEIKTKLEKNND